MKSPDKINGITREVIGKWLSCRAFPCEKERCIDCERYPGDGADVRNAAKATLAYIQQLEAAQPKWISVDDPPKDMRKVFVYLRDGTMAVTYYNPLSEMWDFEQEYKITHWRPLPQPPEVK